MGDTEAERRIVNPSVAILELAFKMFTFLEMFSLFFNKRETDVLPQ